MKWSLINGAWVLNNPSTANGQTEPISRGITPGQAPNFTIKHGEYKNDNLRRFDKPSESQIKALEREDEEATKKAIDVEPVVIQARKDLQIGKIRISPDVLRERDKKITPFTSVEDDRGVTHVIPADRVQVEVHEPIESNTGGSSQASVIESAFHKIRMQGREAYKRRTIT